MSTAVHAIEGSGVGRMLRESMWAYPITETLHIIGLATLFGSVLVVDLRLLGLNRGLSVARLARHALPWTVGAFLLVMTSGLLMFTAHAGDFLTNRIFILKMGLIATAGVNAAMLHTGVMRTAAAWDINVLPPARVRWSAVLSIMLWMVVIACGRFLAYT